MKTDVTRSFVGEIYSTTSKEYYESNKTISTFFDDTWCSDLLDFVEDGPSNNKSHRYILVVIGNFFKYRRTIPFKNKYAQTIANAFHKIMKHQNLNSISLKQMMK